ncbi:MAG TPA: FtsX-like permease family protein [Vicinamibacterales bacterium]|nr:FtsX-like permease family protein [Vicinamibacterales bacterium]
MYGLVSFTTATRRREFGIRLALGARPSDLLRLALGEGVRLAMVGLVAGLIVAASTSSVLGSLLFGVTPTDGLTFAAIAVVLLGVSIRRAWSRPAAPPASIRRRLSAWNDGAPGGRRLDGVASRRNGGGRGIDGRGRDRRLDSGAPGAAGEYSRGTAGRLTARS